MPFGSAFSRIKSFVNGGTLLPADLNSIQDDYGAQVQAGDIATGATGGSVVRRGKSMIAGVGDRTNVAFGALGGVAPGPDQVQSVVLPTDGLICVAYQALWKSSALTAGNAAIFIGANQLKWRDKNAAAPAVAQCTTFNDANEYAGISTSGWGLGGVSDTGQTESTSDVTTGQSIGGITVGNLLVGGPVYIFAAAGTYDVSVQFKATSGTVSVKERKLWVWTMGF